MAAKIFLMTCVARARCPRYLRRIAQETHGKSRPNVVTFVRFPPSHAVYDGTVSPRSYSPITSLERR